MEGNYKRAVAGHHRRPVPQALRRGRARARRARAGARRVAAERRRAVLRRLRRRADHATSSTPSRAFCAAEGLDPDAVRRPLPPRPARRARCCASSRAGASTRPTSSRGFAALLGCRRPRRARRRGCSAACEPDDAMLDARPRARAAPASRTGLVSNSWGARPLRRATLLDELFDGVVISGEVGMRKPEPAIYVLGAERVGAAPERCVFVDDLPDNLDPARELGMAAVHHTSARDDAGGARAAGGLARPLNCAAQSSITEGGVLAVPVGPLRRSRPSRSAARSSSSAAHARVRSSPAKAMSRIGAPRRGARRGVVARQLVVDERVVRAVGEACAAISTRGRSRRPRRRAGRRSSARKG